MRFVSKRASREVMELLVPMIDCGPAPVTLEIRGTEGELLASLQFGQPAFEIAGGVLVGKLDPVTVTASGEARFGRLLAGDGEPILEFDIGLDEGRSNASFVLNTLSFRRGGPLTLNNFEFPIG